MKKLLQILTASILSVAFVGAAAGAQVAPSTSCNDVTISNTGPGSNNTVTCTNVVNTVIKCENNVIVGTANVQTSNSGNASGQNNTTVGSVNTGTAVNYNGTDTTIGASCGAVATPAASTPVTPGMGSITPPAAEEKVAPAVLPYTAGASAEAIVIASLIAAAAVVVLSRVAVAAYRRISTR